MIRVCAPEVSRSTADWASRQAVPAADGQVEALLDRLAVAAACVLGVHGAGFRPVAAGGPGGDPATPVWRVQGWQPGAEGRTGSSEHTQPQTQPRTQPRTQRRGYRHTQQECCGRGQSSGPVSVLSIPLMVSGRVWGAFHLCRPASQVWTERDRVLVGMFADLAVSYIGMGDERDRADRLAGELEHRASHDELTGLPNRRVLFDRLEHAIVSAARTRTLVAVLFIDIDGFKEVNDSLGHLSGDLVLAEVARRLQLVLRAGDTLARLGGDEFVVVCEGLTGTSAQNNRWLRGLGRRIQLQLHRPPADGEMEVFLSVSIGVAVTKSTALVQPRPARELIGEADRAMYAAKQAGGGRLIIAGREVVPLVHHPPVQVPRKRG
jgi:diguanylate cyclase (GGDEF)-like protein